MKKNWSSIKEISVLIILTLFLIWGIGVKNLIVTPGFKTGNAINDSFVLFSLNGEKSYSSILSDIKYLVMGDDYQLKETDNQVLVEETAPDTTAVETTISYDKTGTDVNWNNVRINNHTKYQIDLENKMKNYTPPKKKLSPQILIVHTHGTEGYIECKNSRTENKELNVVKVGETLKNKLEEYGFKVLHDPKMHDLPSYNGSYVNTLKTLNWYMENYGSIDIVLDVHRDAVEREDGSKVKVVSEQKGKKAAQVMFVVGTDECGLSHPNWRENLCLAAGLNATGEKLYPNFFRPIDLRQERFNQHLTKGSLIVEVGTNGNSLEEAVYSAEILAEIINAYIK